MLRRNRTVMVANRLAAIAAFMAFRFVAFSLAVVAVTVPSVAATPTSNPIVVGSEVDFPPYAMVDGFGRPTGFSVELMQAVAEQMGIPITFRTGEWNEVWEGLKRGGIQAAPLVAWSPERDSQVDFTIAHTTAHDSFFVRKGTAPIASIAEARTRVVAVMRGDAAHEQLLARGFGHGLVVTGTIPEAVGLLVAGRCDAILVPTLLGHLTLRQAGLSNAIVSGPPLTEYKRQFHFAVAKGMDDLRARLDQGIAVVKATGRYDKLYAKWFGDLAPPKFNLRQLAWWAGVPTAIAVGLFALLLFVRRQVGIQRAASAEAERANKAKSRFLAAVSHDLRQPLQGLNLYFAALADRVDPGERRIVDNIEKCLSSLNRLLDDLLELSRLEAGALTPRVEDVPLAEIVDAAISAHAPAAATKGLRLRQVPTALIVRTDRVLCERIIGNLISNAVRYTDRGGVVVGCRRRAPGMVSIEVWDSGIGIPAPQIATVFEEFKRLDKTNRGMDGGAGLGLSIVQRTAALLRHHVTVASTPGRGSVFAVSLPLTATSPR